MCVCVCVCMCVGVCVCVRACKIEIPTVMIKEVFLLVSCWKWFHYNAVIVVSSVLTHCNWC